MTTSSAFPITTSGLLQVTFNSVQLDSSSPQAYAFGVGAVTATGFAIINLHWDFGDGITLDVPYCCQAQVSEVQYHAYQQPGTYVVRVVATDSGGNNGEAFVTVSWPIPIPEFPTTTAPLLASTLMVLAAAAILKRSARPRNLQF
jgi:PKD repeat protein